MQCGWLWTARRSWGPRCAAEAVITTFFVAHTQVHTGEVPPWETNRRDLSRKGGPMRYIHRGIRRQPAYHELSSRRDRRPGVPFTYPKTQQRPKAGNPHPAYAAPKVPCLLRRHLGAPPP